MIDEATYNTLKRFIEACHGYNKLLSEVGYIEVLQFNPTVCKITSLGELALREYEMYAERKRIEDDRYAKDNRRSVLYNTAGLIFTVIAAVAGVVAAVVGILQMI